MRERVVFPTLVAVSPWAMYFWTTHCALSLTSGGGFDGMDTDDRQIQLSRFAFYSSSFYLNIYDYILNYFNFNCKCLSLVATVSCSPTQYYAQKILVDQYCLLLDMGYYYYNNHHCGYFKHSKFVLLVIVNTKLVIP